MRCKRRFWRKLNADSTVENFKGRLAACGYNQESGVDEFRMRASRDTGFEPGASERLGWGAGLDHAAHGLRVRPNGLLSSSLVNSLSE